MLPDAAKAVLDSPEFATLATIEPDGQPQLSVVWVARDGDDVLVSTVKGRRKHRNLERDPRATVLVLLRDDPYRYVEVRGTATMVDEGGPELIQQLSQKYRGRPYTADDGTGNVRVVVRITPEKVVVRGG
jgi:PPOX class probable F420-dependent enzyme